MSTLKLRLPRWKTGLALSAVMAVVVGFGATLFADAATGVTPTAGGTYTLTSASSGQCLDVTAGSKSNGALLQQWGCPKTGAAWQQFTLRQVTAGVYNLVNVNSGLCLDIKDGMKANGVPVQQWGCGGGGATWQQFTLVKGDAGYQLKNVNSGACLDLKGGSKANGAAIQQWGCNNSDATWQQWTFASVPSAASPAPAPSPAPTGDTSTVGTVIKVAADGSGDVTTVQAAVDRVPAGNTKPYTVLISKGTYSGQVSVPATKPFITIMGATPTATDVVLTANRPTANVGMQGSATAYLAAANTTVKNLTIINAYDEAANGAMQALALYTAGDRQVFRNIRAIGDQDTLLTSSGGQNKPYRQYFYGSYIEGDVDFIYGDGTAVFDSSTIHSSTRGSTSNNGYITAASTWSTNRYGLLFVNSNFTSDAPAGTVSLGRPWHAGGNADLDGQVLVRNSTLGAHIRTSQPWTDMGGFSWKTEARFNEYQNTGSGATVNSNRPQLSDADAADYTVLKYLAGSDGWNPTATAATPSASPTATSTSPTSSWSDKADGFASINAMGQNGTTGGAGGQTVTVTNQADLNRYATATEPYVIKVKGAITISPKGTEIRVQSDKTIIGVGATGEIVGGGFFLAQGVHNVIIRNLTIRDTLMSDDDPGDDSYDYDAIQMDGAHHVWIDHNRLTRMNDGLIDSRKDTTYLTVSYNVLADNNKTFGIGWTDNVTARITIHHNWIMNTNQRNPSADNIAYAHLYNNYLQNNSSYGNFARGLTKMVIENSYYDKVTNPYFVEQGELKESGSIVVNSSWASGKTKTKGSAFDPKSFYSYTLDPAADVPALLKSKAGPQASIG